MTYLGIVTCAAEEQLKSARRLPGTENSQQSPITATATMAASQSSYASAAGKLCSYYLG